MQELRFSVECRNGTDVFQIEGLYPSSWNGLSKEIINELVNGQEFHNIDEIITYLFAELQARGIRIEKSNIQIVFDDK